MAPARQLLVTWNHAAHYRDDTRCPSNADLTFSLIANEKTDVRCFSASLAIYSEPVT